MKAEFVFPNLTKNNLGSTSQRGGLSERWKLAGNLRCTFIEISATLIKNKTEEKLTSLKIGDFLTNNEIAKLYTSNNHIPMKLKYIMHTEPALTVPNLSGRRITPDIQWRDEKWCDKYLEMIHNITRFFHHPASVIEIHPGFKENTFQDIARFISKLRSSYKKEFNITPLILLENRTEQFISTGKDIENYWHFLNYNFPELIQNTGIVLDIQQLYTRTTNNFFTQFNAIPQDCLKAFHIHTDHRAPMLNDRIPWKVVFGLISELDHSIIINPEIHQKRSVKTAIEFCKKLL